MRAAGIGPSSAIARTMDTNAPEMLIPRISTVRTSLPIVSTSRSRTSSIGCQLDLVSVTTARATAAASTMSCAMAMMA